MFQRIVRSLRQKGLLVSAGVIFALIVVLSVIIILGQFFHQSLQEEMAEQFNKQQLLLSREVAVNVESYVDYVYKAINVISHLPDVQNISQNSQVRIAADAISFAMQSEALVSIRVVSRNGILLYDSSDKAYPAKKHLDLSNKHCFQRAQLLPKNEKLITDLLSTEDACQGSQEFIVAVPIYVQTEERHSAEFSGVVFAVLSMTGLTERFLAPVKSGSRGYAWMMDNEGTLLYHPTQPRMVGKNLYQTDKTCFQCHKSFDAEKKMIQGREETFGYYEAPGGENKLAAFYRLPIARKSWIVVVSAPYSDVIALMQKSRRIYTLLIISIFFTTLVASGATIVTYKKKIKVEEKEKHLENERRLEREIEISKDYLENIIENTQSNLMVLDKDLVIITANTAQSRTCGRPKHELVGQSFFSIIPEDIAVYHNTPLRTYLQKTLSGHSFELKDFRTTHSQDDPLYLTMNISPLLIDGRNPGILITSTNVTKRVQLEGALKQYTVELEDKVDQGTATAKKLEQQVLHSEKLAALGRLAAGVAHEIGNPLTSISSFAQMMREMAQDEFTKKSLDIINTHIQRIADIVRRMATFARADSLTIKDVQINDVLNETLDLMRLDKRMKSSVQIAVELDPGLPKVLIDEGQISQVFINIIINALDAMAGGGTLSVGTRRGRDDRGGEAVMVSFADSGTGIPPAELQKIFDPFYTTKEAGKGTGLGLSLSYDIVKRFKGDIRAESEVGKGTVFIVVLPVEASETSSC